MKFRFKFVLIILVISILALSISAFAPVVAIELPEQLVEVISFVAMFLATALARWVASKLGFDIQDRAAEIASAVGAIIVVGLNHYLAFLPIQYESFVEAVFAFLTVLFGGNGLYSLLLRKKVRG